VDETHVAIGQIRPDAIAGPCRVRRVIDHRYEPRAETRIEPLSRAAALVLMGSAAPRLRHLGERGLGLLASIMGDADAYSLVTGDLDQSARTVGGL
jgi:hypothetical protein